MSGCYKGVQALILEKNFKAIFAPCSAHTLNLCGVHAVEVAREIKIFFGNVQRLYNIFSGSPAQLIGKFLKKLLVCNCTAYRTPGGVQELMLSEFW